MMEHLDVLKRRAGYATVHGSRGGHIDWDELTPEEKVSHGVNQLNLMGLSYFEHRFFARSGKRLKNPKRLTDRERESIAFALELIHDGLAAI